MPYADSPALSHYLTNFVFYTLIAVALIYWSFWYLRQKMGKAQNLPHPGPPVSDDAPPSTPNMPLGLGSGLEVESVLPLENQQSLYVLRAGRERFLMSISGDKTTLLSKLESASMEDLLQASGGAQLPWFKTPKPEESPPVSVPRPSASQRFMQSLNWLVSARSGGAK
jgi:hypothetical protein